MKSIYFILLLKVVIINNIQAQHQDYLCRQDKNYILYNSDEYRLYLYPDSTYFIEPCYCEKYFKDTDAYCASDTNRYSYGRYNEKDGIITLNSWIHPAKKLSYLQIYIIYTMLAINDNVDSVLIQKTSLLSDYVSQFFYLPDSMYKHKTFAKELNWQRLGHLQRRNCLDTAAWAKQFIFLDNYQLRRKETKKDIGLVLVHKKDKQLLANSKQITFFLTNKSSFDEQSPQKSKPNKCSCYSTLRGSAEHSDVLWFYYTDCLPPLK